MRIEKVKYYIDKILRKHNKESGKRIYSGCAYPDPLGVFRDLFQEYWASAGIQLPFSITMFWKSPLHYDFLIPEARLDLAKLKKYLTEQASLPPQQQYDDSVYLNALIIHSANYLRKNPVDVQSDFYDLLVAFFYVYGRPLDMGPIPSVLADVSEYSRLEYQGALTKYPLTWLRGKACPWNEKLLTLDLPLSYFQQMLVEHVIPRLDVSDDPSAPTPFEEIQALSVLVSIKKIPDKLAHEIVNKLLRLLDSYPSNAEIIRLVYMTLGNPALKIPEALMAAVISELMKELSNHQAKDHWSPRPAAYYCVGSLSIPAQYQIQVVRELLVAVDVPSSTVYSIYSLSEMFCGGMIPKEMQDEVTRKLLAKCEDKFYLPQAAVALSRMNVCEDVNLVNIKALLEIIKTSNNEAVFLALGEVKIPKSLHTTIVQAIVAKLGLVEGVSIADCRNAMVAILRGDRRIINVGDYLNDVSSLNLELTCQLLAKIAPRSIELDLACCILLVQNHCENLLCGDWGEFMLTIQNLFDMEHSAAFQEMFLEYYFTANPTFIHSSEVDMFPHLELRFQAAFLARLQLSFPKSPEDSIKYLWYANILSPDAFCGELLKLKNSNESYLNRLPTDLVINVARLGC